MTNEIDPLFIFHDGVFHEACFARHPLKDAAIERYASVETHSNPETWHSFISGLLIDDPTDYLPVGHLTDDEGSPLFEFNFAHFRRSELKEWDRLTELIDLLTASKERGELAGVATDWLLDQLCAQTA